MPHSQSIFYNDQVYSFRHWFFDLMIQLANERAQTDRESLIVEHESTVYAGFFLYVMSKFEVVIISIFCLCISLELSLTLSI